MSNERRKRTISARPQNLSGTLNGRATIGLLLPCIGSVTETLWSAALDAATEQDVNLICFFGGVYDAAQANVLYDLVSTERMGALIIAPGNLLIPQDHLQCFFDRFHLLPTVSLGAIVAGVPSLLPDNYRGMCEVIAHLIQDHGYRRIAFVRGPIGIEWAEERYRAYVDTLAEHGLPLDLDLVLAPSVEEVLMDAELILGVLLDERGLQPQVDVEAVVMCSDDAAARMLQALRGRGIRVPAELAVTGFNDEPCAKACTPPLTTVRQPLYEIGRQAVEIAVARLQGQYVAEKTILPARLVVRRSCGCPSRYVVQAAVGQAPVEQGRSCKEMLDDRRASICAAMEQALESVPGGWALFRANVFACKHPMPPGWANRLLDAWVADMLSEPGEPVGVFVSTLEEMLHQAMTVEEEVEIWQAALSALRRHVLPCLGNVRVMSRADDLWQQARLVISETAQRLRLYQALQAEHRANVLRGISAALISTLDLGELMDVLAEGLSELDIPSAYLSLYEDPARPTEWARLVLAYGRGGCPKLVADGQRFPSPWLAPEGVLPSDRRYSFVVEPLYFREDQIGLALFEVGSREGNVYEVLRAEISSVLRAELMYDEALKARAAAERADRLKTRLLANVSHELRAPLHVILSHTRAALSPPGPYPVDLPFNLMNSLQQIRANAEHQLRMVNDLLDLSRAEIDELSLSPALIDPRPFLEEVFRDVTAIANPSPDVAWRLQLPERLPAIEADPNRLRQILFNLLSNASKFTEKGQILLGAEVSIPHLHIWVQDTGLGIPIDQQQHIFEPFVTLEHKGRRPEGIGLGLSITRRLVALHGGTITLESRPDQGSTFHVYLPLPSLSEQPRTSFVPSPQPTLLVVSAHDQVAGEIVELARRQGLEIRRLRVNADVDGVLAAVRPAAVAWDRASASPWDATLIRRLCDHPQLCQVPFIFYSEREGDEPTIGVTNILAKPVVGETLLEVIGALCSFGPAGPVLIVDDDPGAREFYRGAVETGLPGCQTRLAADGTVALAMMTEQVPCLVILDLAMPELDGFEVLDWMRSNPQTRQVPVLVLSGRVLSFDDIKRLERYAQVILQSKDIWSEHETTAVLHRMLFDDDGLPVCTSSLVKRAVAYFHEHYARPLSRQEMAKAIGVHQDYLSQIFHQELGLCPWDYLNRYRIARAKDLLGFHNASITAVAFDVGFSDPAYFSRVFRKVTGLSPSAYRQSLLKQGRSL